MASELKNLLQELRVLGTAFENIKGPRADKDKRVSVARALIAVVKFVDEQPQSSDVDTVLLRRMIEALSNVEQHGKTTSWLLNPIPNRHAVPPKIIKLRRQRAEEMDKLMKPPHRMSRKTAARKIADSLTPTSTLLLGTSAYGAVSNDEIWPVVARWRDDLLNLRKTPKSRD